LQRKSVATLGARVSFESITFLFLYLTKTQMPMHHFKNTLLAFTAGVAGALATYCVVPSPTHAPQTEVATVQPVRFAALSHDISLNKDFVEASQASTPAVVFIKTSSTVYNQMSWFDYYFYGGNPTQQRVNSGSGVIFSKNGYIVTNNHVIDKADKIEVIHEKRSYIAKLIGTDATTDIALLKIEAENLPSIRIGSSKEVQVGEWVLAVGNPFNLATTVTAGIVSAKGRHVGVVNSRFPIESFIQTDAAINPGNSGGALVNIKGELIGINTAILSQTGSYAGYGFAVPADIVNKVVNDIKEFGHVQKAFSGIDVAERIPNSTSGDVSGVNISYLVPNSAAATKGLKKGDILLQIDNTPINSLAAYDEQMSYYRPGDKIKITYKRDEESMQTEIILTNNEGTTSLIKKEVHQSEILGAQLEMVPKIERDRLNIASGVRLSKLKGNGLVSRLGLTEGFIITSINNNAPAKPTEVEEILSKIRGNVNLEGITENGQKVIYRFRF
jgi:S1-C subfamily serine protease